MAYNKEENYINNQREKKAAIASEAAKAAAKCNDDGINQKSAKISVAKRRKAGNQIKRNIENENNIRKHSGSGM